MGMLRSWARKKWITNLTRQVSANVSYAKICKIKTDKELDYKHIGDVQKTENLDESVNCEKYISSFYLEWVQGTKTSMATGQKIEPISVWY